MNRIIYQTEDGGVAVIIPAESVELALKDVPEGVAYEIVSADNIDRKSTRLNSSHVSESRMPSSA